MSTVYPAVTHASVHTYDLTVLVQLYLLQYVHTNRKGEYYLLP
jgi:hypothetical protein